MSNTEELKQLVFLMPKELHAEFKTKCVREGVTIKSVLVAMVEEYVKNDNKKQDK